MGRYSVKSSDNWQYHVPITCNTVTINDAVMRAYCYIDMVESDTRVFHLYMIMPLTVRRVRKMRLV